MFLPKFGELLLYIHCDLLLPMLLMLRPRFNQLMAYNIEMTLCHNRHASVGLCGNKAVRCTSSYLIQIHDLHNIAKRVTVNNISVFFEFVMRPRTNVHTLLGSFPLVSQTRLNSAICARRSSSDDLIKRECLLNVEPKLSTVLLSKAAAQVWQINLKAGPEY